jgi:acetyl-CoA C-acetyltransferase
MFHPAELACGLVMPTQFYPLFENALRHESGRGFDEHQAWVGSWWAPMSEVAAENPYAWRASELTAQEVVTPTATNRMVGLPYTKSMVSNPDVDMGAGFVMCSAAKAESLGIPSDRWVFVHAGTDGVDRFPSDRASFTGSASMRVAGRRALELAEVAIDDLDLLDVYSCFPSAIEVAAKELQFELDRPLTVYGGLCFAGGPWNNPVSHAIAAMYTKIRDGAGSNGLVTANGGNIGKHGFVVLSDRPAAAGFRWEHPQSEIDAEPPVSVVQDYTGLGEVETWTVMFDREGQPETAHAAVRMTNGERTWARTDDRSVAEVLSAGEWIGAEVHVAAGRLTL